MRPSGASAWTLRPASGSRPGLAGEASDVVRLAAALAVRHVEEGDPSGSLARSSDPR